MGRGELVVCRGLLPTWSVLAGWVSLFSLVEQAVSEASCLASPPKHGVAVVLAKALATVCKPLHAVLDVLVEAITNLEPDS